MKQLTILVLFAVFLMIVVAQSPSDQPTTKEKREFKQWMKKHSKKYDSKEDEERAMMNWLEHKREIDEHNKQYKEGKKHHKLMLNEHSDLTHEEMEEQLTGLILAPIDDENMNSRKLRGARFSNVMPNYKKPPKMMDWRKKGLVTRVENQGACGSCWAFSVAAIINAMVRKKNKGSKTLASPQEMVDCIRDETHFGCHGGDPTRALMWIEDNGITTEEQYPYKAEQQDCQTNNTKAKDVKIKEVYQIVFDGNETAMEYVSGNVGPVSITLCIESDFYHLGDGVYKHDNCCTSPAHAPVLVGYGRDRVGGDYWLIKNSWGTTWGVNGYGKIARNYPETNGNMCGIGFAATWSE